MRRLWPSSLVVLIVAVLLQCGQGQRHDDQNHPPEQDPVRANYELTIDWENIPEGRIFQRNAEGMYSLVIKGTFQGGPKALEARIVQAEDGQEVVGWTEIVSAPTAGEFLAGLPGIPQGGWYQLQVRADENNITDYHGTPRFGVGVLIACLGQSHIDGWFDPKARDPKKTADDWVRMYRHEQVYQAGPKWDGWQPVTGLAATVFGNAVSRALNVPVGLLDYGVQGASLWQTNSLVRIFGWWVADESGVDPQSNNYSVLVSGLESIDHRIEAALWIQGHTDGMKKDSTAHYRQGLEKLFANLRQDTQTPQLPVFFSLVARQGPSLGIFKTTPDEDIQAIRDAELQYIEQDPNAYLGCTTMDLPLDATQVHHAVDGQIMQAQRMALAVVSIVGRDRSNRYRGPKILGYTVVDQHTIDISLQHVSGDDFTPHTDIQGFRVQGDGVGKMTAVLRHAANTIRITISGDTSTIDHVDYLYGGNPGKMDLHSYIDQYVHDNSELELPLEGNQVLPAL